MQCCNLVKAKTHVHDVVNVVVMACEHHGVAHTWTHKYTCQAMVQRWPLSATTLSAKNWNKRGKKNKILWEIKHDKLR